MERRGFTLLATGMCCAAVFGMVGLAVDVGSMYIVRNENQAYVDSASLAAALELDGTTTGFARARGKVAGSVNRWNMGTTPFTATTVEFSTSSSGPWAASPFTGTNYVYVRVRNTAAVPVYFMPVISRSYTSEVSALAIAGQIPQTEFSEGLFPFSPMAHNSTGPDFGLEKGGQYTLRWPSSPKLGHNVCPGDDQTNYIVQAQAGGGEERGFIEETSADIIRAAIVDNYQTIVRVIGDTVIMTGGAKQTTRSSLIERINQDSDSTSSTFSEYLSRNTGNGRRIVVAPINTWHPDYRIVGYGAFFLQPSSQYGAGGNQPFCAEYVGAYVQGSSNTGGGQPGAYVVRLVE